MMPDTPLSIRTAWWPSASAIVLLGTGLALAGCSGGDFGRSREDVRNDDMHRWLGAEATGSVGLRPYTVYGPGRSIGVTAGPTLAMRAAAERTPYTIPFTGSTGMDYVADVAAVFVRAATETPDDIESDRAEHRRELERAE